VALWCAEMIANALGREAVMGDPPEDPDHAKQRVEAKLQRAWQDYLMGKTYEAALDWAGSDWMMRGAIMSIKRWAYVDDRWTTVDGKRQKMAFYDWGLIHSTWNMAQQFFSNIAYGVGRQELMDCRAGREVLAKARTILDEAYPSERGGRGKKATAQVAGRGERILSPEDIEKYAASVAAERAK